MGASFVIATGGLLSLFIAAKLKGSLVWVRIVDEVSGAVFEQEVTADQPAATQFGRRGCSEHRSDRCRRRL